MATKPSARKRDPQAQSAPLGSGGLRVVSPGTDADADRFANLRVFDHPLIRVKLTRLRDRRTGTADFRRTVHEITCLMVGEATRALMTRRVDVSTPYEDAHGDVLAKPLTIVPILRAGLGMAEGALAVIPEARVGHVGIYRNESSLEPVPYYAKLPRDVAEGPVLVVDPMLATGGTAAHAVSVLKRNGCTAIALLCLVAAPEGVSRLLERHGDVEIFAAALDRELTRDGRILPGLGDAGDRIFGTPDARTQA